MQYVVATKSSGLNVHTGPGASYRVTRSLPRGTIVEVVGSSGSWRRIAAGGWVAGALLRPPAKKVGSTKKLPSSAAVYSPGRYVVATQSSDLNVRSGPGTGHRVIRSLPKGTAVQVVESRGGWCRLAAGGWVFGKYLEASAEPRPDAEATRWAETVKRILNDPAMRRINFRYGSLPVYGSGFARVARAIDEGRVDVVPEDLTRSGAEYDFNENVIVVKRGANLGNLIAKGVIVHEATHALQDYQRTRMSGSHSEGAAFVAQHFYYLLKAPQLLDHPAPDNVAGVALSIARRIYTTSGGYLVFASEVEALRSKMLGGGYSSNEMNAVRVTNGF